MKITKMDILKLERIARRNVEIELRLPKLKSSIVKSKKTYNRKDKHKKSI